MNILNLIGRAESLFDDDLSSLSNELIEIISKSSFLVIGGAGSIGQAVVKEIFTRNPKLLHVVDISENNLVELVRDLRSSYGYTSGEFKTFAIDCGSVEYELLVNNHQYDYVLNLSALKHVRSEKDIYTLMRMIRVNVLNTIKTIEHCNASTKKYFCVSTDKAANPANLMGASKRIMELFLFKESRFFNISTARFANVAFSDGSLLHGFNLRLQKRQPIAAPKDIKRYFLLPKESGELCLLSAIFGENRDIFFPKLNDDLHLINFSEIATRYLNFNKYEPYMCESEDEARDRTDELIAKGKWPCYFFNSDTTGEKEFEEFYTENEIKDLSKFNGVGVVKNNYKVDVDKLNNFQLQINNLIKSGNWSKSKIINLFEDILPEFNHVDKGKNLDEKM
jgi:FlaA1/EpsC-like NDP-sugar epimerase